METPKAPPYPPPLCGALPPSYDALKPVETDNLSQDSKMEKMLRDIVTDVVSEQNDALVQRLALLVHSLSLQKHEADVESKGSNDGYDADWWSSEETDDPTVFGRSSKHGPNNAKGSKSSKLSVSGISTSNRNSVDSRMSSYSCRSGVSVKMLSNEVADRLLLDYTVHGTCPVGDAQVVPDFEPAQSREGSERAMTKTASIGMSKLTRTTSVALSSHSGQLQMQSAHIKALLLLRVGGVIPWTNMLQDNCDERRWCRFTRAWYQLVVFALAASSCAISIQTIFRAQHAGGQCLFSHCLQTGILTDIAMAFGGLVSLSLVLYREEPYLAHVLLLRTYAEHEDFQELWLRNAHVDTIVTVLIWIAAVAERVRGSDVFLQESDPWEYMRILSFAVSSLILCSVAYCILYFCSSMMCVVDSFCIRVVEGQKFAAAVPLWNSVQALLRKTSDTCSEAMCLLQAVVFLVCMFGTVDVYQSAMGNENVNVHLLVPALVVLIAVSRIVFRAADVAGKCERVPPLINSFVFGPDVDETRQYLVQYVLNSAAGFYVFNLRLTSEMAFNYAYFCVVVIFVVVQQMLKQM